MAVEALDLPVCEMVALKLVLLRRNLLDSAENTAIGPERLIRWMNGGPVRAGGATAEMIRAGIGYSPEAMADLITEASAVEV